MRAEGGGAREWREQGVAGNSLKSPSTDKELYVECPEGCKSNRARVSTWAVLALLGLCLLQRGAVTAPSPGLM